MTVIARTHRYVRAVLLPASAAPLLTAREALHSIWGGLGLMLAVLLLTRTIVMPMSPEQPLTLKLAVSVLTAVGAIFAYRMMAAGVRNRFVQLMDEFIRAEDDAQGAANRSQPDDEE